jgi:DNA-binding FrmR family transcriptional regulator
MGYYPAMAEPTGRSTSAHGAEHTSFRHSYTKDKAQLVRRLSRIEGQVRGIARMIEREEYCVDILQQTAALRAAIDAVSILVLEDHVQGCVRTARWAARFAGVPAPAERRSVDSPPGCPQDSAAAAVRG